MLIEVRNEADTVMTHVRRALGQGGALVGPEERERITVALAALEGVRDTSDRDAIRERTTELNQATEHLAEVMMDTALRGALGSRRAQELLEPK
jgi:molecular chaperone DnaK (HSP70)